MNEAMPLLVDMVIALTVLEGLALAVWGRPNGRANGRGIAPQDVLINLLSGFCLMLALRCAVRQVGAEWILLCLLAAGAAHGTDLRARWRRMPRGAQPGALS